MDEPRKAYEGQEPYLFASYSHKDRERVLPLIGLMQEVGCRVWYDDGIPPVKKYDDVIASHIENSRLFTCFMSNAYTESGYCKKELEYAERKEKEILPIYIEKPEEIQIPSGMDMHIGGIEHIDLSNPAPCERDELKKRLEMTQEFGECIDSDCEKRQDNLCVQIEHAEPAAESTMLPAPEPAQKTEPTAPPAMNQPPTPALTGTDYATGRRRKLKKKCFQVAAILIAVIVIGSILLNVLSSGVNPPVQNGPCGENVQGVYDDDSRCVTISGTGSMWNSDRAKTRNFFYYGQAVDSVVIEEGITSVGAYNFLNCSTKSCTLPESLLSIEEYAFSQCSSLESIKIPNQMIIIGNEAFEDCSSLKEVDLGPSVANIGYCAFVNCNSISSVTIPESVCNIGWGAFGDCLNLRSITFEGDAPSIGFGAFGDVTAVVYYHPEKKGWDAVVGENYWGRLKWVPIQEEPPKP